MKMGRIYSPDEVSVHNSAKDLWITMHDRVYNLTDFLTKHPGGEEVLLALAGKDGTICFDEIGHSEEAVQLRETYKIGDVTGDASVSVGNATTTNKREPTVDDDDWVYEAPKKKSSPYLPLFIGIGVLAYAILFYHLF